MVCPRTLGGQRVGSIPVQHACVKLRAKHEFGATQLHVSRSAAKEALFVGKMMQHPQTFEGTSPMETAKSKSQRLWGNRGERGMFAGPLTAK